MHGRPKINSYISLMKKLKSIKHVSLTYKLNIECVYKVLCLGEKYFLGGETSI